LGGSTARGVRSRSGLGGFGSGLLTGFSSLDSEWWLCRCSVEVRRELSRDW
jgi:hypothetical protein